MVYVIATQKLTYAGRVLSPGDKFSASEEDARLLKGWDKAKDADAPQEPQREALFAQEPPAERSKRKYKRRDLVAEDGVE